MIYELTGTVQNYDWGGKDFIPDLLNLKKEPNTTYAEYWLGAHDKSPSVIKTENGEIKFNEFLNQRNEKLPFLLKILDVAKPLSIQIHPTKEQAVAGFAKENAEGIPLNSPMRIFQDDNHKPEMMLALSEFWLLHGFAMREIIIKNLENHLSLADLANIVKNQGIATAYKKVMLATQEQLFNWLAPVIEISAKGNYEKSSPEFWINRTIELMQISTAKLDAGLFGFFFFNIVKLNKGEAIFQDALIPHAYLEGQNIELMANSNNVIRGGLTTKKVAVQTLLDFINFQEVKPEILTPVEIQPSILKIFLKNFSEFEMQIFDPSRRGGGDLKLEKNAILLVLDVQNNEENALPRSMQAFWIPAGSSLDKLPENKKVILAVQK